MDVCAAQPLQLYTCALNCHLSKYTTVYAKCSGKHSTSVQENILQVFRDTKKKKKKTQTRLGFPTHYIFKIIYSVLPHRKEVGQKQQADHGLVHVFSAAKQESKVFEFG